ncbi:hypothetical protein B0H13DRAFT_921291 [Mycena leptocephala]|nr:hypothetical protein B0H13DRAFT_921291 [Mycena leptocephala]
MVRNDDCIEAIERMRRAAPSPDQDPYHRATAHTRLLNWGRQQEALLERLRDEENRHVIHSMQSGLDIVHRFLEPLMDRAATITFNGRTNGSGFLDAERTLDLVTQRVGPGKRKVRDESLVAVSGDGKRMRQLGGSAWERNLACCTALQAEVARLRAYLAPIIDVRGHFKEFLSRLIALAAHRRYFLDMTVMEQESEASCPLLKWEECAQLRILKKAFYDKGQLAVVSAIDAVLNIRFRDAHVIAHLLHFDILNEEDCCAPGEDVRASGIAEVFERMTPPGKHIPGPLFRVHPGHEWVTNTTCGRDSRPISPVIVRREGLFGPIAPFRVYDEFGNYVPRPVVRSPIPVPFKSRRMD